MSRIYRIVDRDGSKVCDRATKRECLELLRSHAGTKYWSNGPYTILRIETTHVTTFRPRTPHDQPKEKE